MSKTSAEQDNSGQPYGVPNVITSDVSDCRARAVAERAAFQCQSISDRITVSCREQIAPEDYVRVAAHHDPYRFCEDLPLEQERIADELERRFPSHFADYQRIALAELIVQRLQAPDFARLPSAIRQRSLDWFERILDDIEEMPANALAWRALDNIKRSDLLKDFAVTAGRALPLSGAWIAERRRMLQAELFPSDGNDSERVRLVEYAKRRLPFALGPARNLRRAWRERRGEYDDYLVIHTANRYRRYFSARHMKRAFADLAELLRDDQTLLGIYRRSWFLDPALEALEPRLSFLRTVPEAHGAESHRIGPIDPDARPEILAFSPKRRAAFERGDYSPSIWASLWRRADVLRWADSAGA